MSNKTPLIVGGVGGALPVVIGLVNADADTLLRGFDALVFLGYVVRTVTLTALGMLLVWLNSETDVKKAFQIGVMAPAIVVGYMNGAQLEGAREELSVAKSQLQSRHTQDVPAPSAMLDEGSHRTGGVFSLIAPAYADETTVPKGLHHQRSAIARVWYGVTGQSDNGWFVVVGTYPTEVAADAEAGRIQALGYDARVFPPFHPNENYGVMIGSWLSLDEAGALKAKAIGDGLPVDTYLWKYTP